jgi:hypothetical protein
MLTMPLALPPTDEEARVPNRAVWSACAVCIVILSACSSAPPRMNWKPPPLPPGAADTCTTATCIIPVTVVINPETGNCIASVPNVKLTVTGAGPRTIQWDMITPGFDFSDERYKYGIFIEHDPTGEFQNASVQGGKRMTIRYEKNAVGKEFKYWLSVRRDSGTKQFCDSLDPWLIS